jgi:streptogramin lyase
MFNKVCWRSACAAIVVMLGFSGVLEASETRVIAGNGELSFVDGTGNDARFNKPIRMAPFGPGRIVIADINNHAIRTVTLAGEVKTIAGGPDRQGHRDGPAATAGFDNPHGVAVADDGRIVVAGAASHTVRLLTPGENGYQVTTLAGVPGQSGNQDGPADQALFNSPHGVIWEADGGVLVVDIGNASIKRIRDGVVTTLATAADSAMVMPIDMMPAVDGSYLIADAGIQKAVRWSPGEKGEVLAPDTELAMPHGIDDDAQGNVYVTEIRGHQVTRIDPAGETSIAAGTGEAGLGLNQLNKPAAVLVHDGYLWIADLGNHRITAVRL